ncbi:Fe(3+) ABC transporter substrate-binding protein [Testudinibacter sp. TR-2022]|uniref:Fe(3+) ABC transporter substrate-binding protein n=1 Tax=Testudinibacter sp. TR-2022 TaxID=2585029 RepID=UPI001117E49D|nr:Fe(3+) ABC transporter substrate-binding protein [Testudinibacter sp. TR-2022]TNH04573.1 Fe(3+) ABC transporter substrate-binding protein [Pasteurellaceae bacterium Phil31]TNH07719.1 Fe(3+) ABC transporter substrate-binding protein [Testudinibacter sp. TR-2022]TNH09800.1 Fe(3+) ABC transporter substrate-binding protein [Testudinibacter sp. TR-2022]TNH13845.1 Fe(3+) ABC transporter substrate-binding protein [Testudinibacter sp. TR-2022]TNH20686.1 Fe(3+) ABC transporter substrate-binding prot
MKKSHVAIALGFSAVMAASAVASEVNVYSYRQPYLIEPILKNFEKESGIKVNLIFDDKGLVERIKREGELSPADVVLTVDIKRVMDVVNAGLAQPIHSHALEENIPAQYRDSKEQWFALTTRARVIYSSKDRVGKLPADFTYYDLAKPEYKGKVCVRSGKNAYNVSLVASMIAHDGEAKAKSWLEGLKANLAQKPQGGDRDQVKAIKEGVCDYAIGNSYYYGKMLDDDKQRSWAEAAYLNFPNQDSYGTHVNISGVVIAKHAPNKDNAVKLVEYLSGNSAQQAYAELNHEYPVKPGVPFSAQVQSWGTFNADKLPLETIAENYDKALKLVDEVKFDL